MSTTAGLAYSDVIPQPGMRYSRYATDNDRFSAAWHAAHCTIEDCERCRDLCDDGQVISCDACGRVHHTDWLGWEGDVDLDGRCTVLCPECEQSRVVHEAIGVFITPPPPVYRLRDVGS